MAARFNSTSAHCGLKHSTEECVCGVCVGQPKTTRANKSPAPSPCKRTCCLHPLADEEWRQYHVILFVSPERACVGKRILHGPATSNHRCLDVMLTMSCLPGCKKARSRCRPCGKVRKLSVEDVKDPKAAEFQESVGNHTLSAMKDRVPQCAHWPLCQPSSCCEPQGATR